MYPTNTQQKRERLRSSATKARGAARITASPMLLTTQAPKAVVVRKLKQGFAQHST
jgi:hypothetical protein